MNWGRSIVTAFVLFAAFIGTLVTICVRQDVQLVTEDYYKEEINYQRQIDRIGHTAGLAEKPSITVDGGQIKVAYTDFPLIQGGDLELFRPSDARLDKQFILTTTTADTQLFSTTGMDGGMYRARLRWTMNGQEYFLEQVIYL